MAKKKGAKGTSNAEDETAGEKQLQAEQAGEGGQQEQQEPAGSVSDADQMTAEEMRYALNMVHYCSMHAWTPVMRASLPIG